MFNAPGWPPKLRRLGRSAAKDNNPSQPDAAILIEPPRKAQRDSLLRQELAHLLDSPEFRRAPVLSRLLAFLVVETLAGRGNSLKAYSVAVDGLGRSGDFDTQTDSYPRVQIGRLRKLLTAHYAAHDPAGEFALLIEPGSYRVRLTRLLSVGRSPARAAYLVPNVADSTPPHDTEQFAETPVRKLSPSIIAVAVIIAVLIFAVALLAVQPDRPPVAIKSISSPVIEVRAIEGSDTRSAAGEAAYGLLVDGLSRSWVAQVRTEDADATNASGDTFTLFTRLMATDPQGQRLLLRLTDARSDILIWSASVILPAKPNEIERMLAPIIARISGSFGVIAATETARHADNLTAGYPCMLRYTRYEKMRDPAQRDALIACLALPVEEQRLQPAILMARAFMALDPGQPKRDQLLVLAEAFAFANQALAANANDPLAHFAQARLSFVAGDCVAGKRHTDLAVNANPYDPVLVAVLAGLMYHCGFPQADALFERAFLIRQSGAIYGRLPLILAMIAQGRTDQLAILAEASERQQGPDLPYFLLCETLIDAATGKPNEARANWQRFLSVSPARESSTDNALREIIASPTSRQQVIAYLKAKHIIAPS